MSSVRVEPVIVTIVTTENAMILATWRVVSGHWLERVEQLLGDTLNRARRRWALPLAKAVLALVPPAVQFEAPARPDAARQVPGDPPVADAAVPMLPPRALLRIGMDELRTRNFINAIAFSTDGRLVAASDADAAGPRFVIFDVRTGRQVKQFVGPGNRWDRVESFAFSPDGTKFLWGTQSGGVALWELETNRLLFREKRRDGAVNDIAFSPDGSLMAIASADVIRLRRGAKPAELVRDLTTRPDSAPGQLDLPKPAGGIMGPHGVGCLTFTPDGTRLVAGAYGDATLYIWRIGDGRLLRRIPGAHGDPLPESVNPRLNSAAVTPDGRRIMSVGQTTKRREKTKLEGSRTTVTMSEVRFWDIETGERVADYHGEQDYGRGYGALSRDGRLVTVADFNRLRSLDAATGQPERSIDLPGSWGGRPAFSADGTLVALRIDNTIALFEVATGRRLHHDESSPVGPVVSMAWSPSGDRIVTGHGGGPVRAWDAASGKLIWHKLLGPVVGRSDSHAQPSFVSFSRDGKLLVTAGDRDGSAKNDNGIVAILETASGRTVREVPQQGIQCVALAPDGRMVVVGTSHGGYGDTHFVGLEVATGRTRWANPPEEQRDGFYPVVDTQFDGNSPWFQAALRDGGVIRFNVLTGHEQRPFRVDWRTAEERRLEQPAMGKPAFSADGHTLVTSHMGWVYVWDVESGTIRREFRHPHPHGCNITLAPDGHTLATSDIRHAGDPGEDTIRLYKIETGEQILGLEPDDGRAAVMAFSPDGTRLFTGFNRGSGIVWDVRRGQGATRAKK